MSDNELFSDSDAEAEDQTVAPDAYITLTERFDQHKLYTILQNQEEIKKQMKRIENEENKELLEVIELYYDKK
jgi:hypothetical protein